MRRTRLLTMFVALLLVLLALPAVAHADEDDDERELRRQAVRELMLGAMVAECSIRGLGAGPVAVAANECTVLGQPVPGQNSAQCQTWTATLAAIAGAFGPTSVTCQERRLGADRARLTFNAPVAQALPGPGNNCGSPTNPIPDLADCIIATSIGNGRAYDLIKRNGEFTSVLFVDGFTGSAGVRDGRPVSVTNARASFYISYGPGAVNPAVFPFPLTAEPRCVRATFREPGRPATVLRFGC